jgi:hypothetical protein
VIVLLFFNLPFDITNNADIDFGNKLVKRIEQFAKENSELPKTDDWKVLEVLGFRLNEVGTGRTYQRINEKGYKLLFF